MFETETATAIETETIVFSTHHVTTFIFTNNFNKETLHLATLQHCIPL